MHFIMHLRNCVLFYKAVFKQKDDLFYSARCSDAHRSIEIWYLYFILLAALNNAHACTRTRIRYIKWSFVVLARAWHESLSPVHIWTYEKNMNKSKCGRRKQIIEGAQFVFVVLRTATFSPFTFCLRSVQTAMCTTKGWFFFIYK